MFILPIMLVLLLLVKLFQLYAIPLAMDSELLEHVNGIAEIREFFLMDVSMSQVFVFCLAIALLIGLPLEMKFNKLRSRAYKKHRIVSKCIEQDVQSVLSLAKARNGYITAADIAAQSESLTLRQAQKIITEFQKQGFVDLSVAQSGDILYYFPGFDQREPSQKEEKNE